MSDVTAAVTGMVGRVRRVDRIWLALGAAFVALAIVQPAQAIDSLEFTGATLAAIAPFLMVAVALAGIVKATGAEALIAKVFQGRIASMILFAALFGGLSPFCSCGVIPLIAALLAIGVPLPAVMAFWLASPIMDPSMFVVTMGALGTGFAVAKTIAAVALGAFGGFATLALTRTGRLADPLRRQLGAGCAGARLAAPAARAEVEWRFWTSPDRRARFGAEALAVTLFLAKWLTLAFFLESLMVAYVPAAVIADLLGGDTVWAIPLAVLVGVPAYLNGYAALGLVSGLLEIGMAPGAAMAFLVAGGVTSIPAAVAVFALVKRGAFFLYIGLALTGATAAGIAFQVAHLI